MTAKRPVSREGFGIIKSKSASNRFFVMIAIVAVLAMIVWYANRPTVQHSAPVGTAVAPEELGGVGVAGVGGDALLNEEKNRYTAPNAVQDLSVGDVIAIPATSLDASGRRKRESWPASAKRYLSQEESLGLRVTGYLIRAKQSGPEACNGGSDSLRDYHIWISDDPQGQKAGAMIVEITPRWKVVHPEWRLRYIEKLAEQHAQVRVTGWLLWDEEHASEVDKSRATQWEIHPVTNFEVRSGGSWRPLASE